MQEESYENSEVISECGKEIEAYYKNLRKGLEKKRVRVSGISFFNQAKF
jgi:hypothetical protein